MADFLPRVLCVRFVPSQANDRAGRHRHCSTCCMRAPASFARWGRAARRACCRHLALAHPGRVALTATVFTTYFQESIGFAVAIDEDERLPAAVARLDPTMSVAYACPGDKPGRRAGASAATVEQIHREGAFAATYVKADGARMRLIKAPAADEPALPACCTTVVPILSVLAVGEPLTARIAHRVEHIASVAGLRENEVIAPVHLGRLLASPDGSLKSIGDASRRSRHQHGRRCGARGAGPRGRRGRACASPTGSIGWCWSGCRKPTRWSTSCNGLPDRRRTHYNPAMAEVVVRIPAALRTFAGDAAELRATAGTVSDVLGELGGRHPQLLQRLLTPDGELRPFVNIYIGRTSVRALSGLATRVADGEVVTILPAVAGG